MKILSIYVPTLTLDKSQLSKNDNETLIQQLKTSQPKTDAYFDEDLELYVVLETDASSNDMLGTLELETIYSSDKAKSSDSKQNVRRTLSILEDPLIRSQNYIVWNYNTKVKPSKNVNKLRINALFKRKQEEVNYYLKPFEETQLIEIGNITLVNNAAIVESSDNNTPSRSIETNYEICVKSLYKMSLKSLQTNDKTLAWLDLSTSNALKEENILVKINSISVDCVGSQMTICTPIQFPFMLTPSTILTIAYKVSSDDESSVKPLNVVVDATIDGKNNIKTQWMSNLDLSSNAHLLMQPGNNYDASGLKGNPTLLPAAKVSKLRSYANLMSKNSPKLLPPKSATLSNFAGTNVTKQADSGMGGKRYTSVRIKSGSNLSLSQLWSGTTSQNFQRGLVVTVSGPTKVKLGETFRWKIQLLNKSSARMDLILYVQSSIKKDYEKNIPPIPIQSRNKNDIVPLFNNNQLVRSFYYKFNRAGIVSLTNNLRVSLEYGNLYECDLELLSVERGMFNIYDFKVLDISSGDIFECNRLLDVLVV
ncbi:hypothetical protein CANINC_001063 [Pichia inconspicua]|uniref:Trafficking protein particle complex II-specific subunit 65 IgD3 domain-containing protein n=1 Tax=Pichia inconspicua TaxID=52247 RepID=A0A4T0X4I6_9ASCO|nr:hypothetical protein CANINC_001063 [[Candida] inconspicua]